MRYCFPLTLRWPPAARVAVVGEQWRREDGGAIVATYNDIEELRWSVIMTKIMNAGNAPPRQAEMFPAERTNYDE